MFFIIVFALLFAGLQIPGYIVDILDIDNPSPAQPQNPKPFKLADNSDNQVYSNLFGICLGLFLAPIDAVSVRHSFLCASNPPGKMSAEPDEESQVQNQTNHSTSWRAHHQVLLKL